MLGLYKKAFSKNYPFPHFFYFILTPLSPCIFLMQNVAYFYYTKVTYWGLPWWHSG